MLLRAPKKTVERVREIDIDHLKERMTEDAIRVSQSAETFIMAIEGLNEVMERIRCLNRQLTVRPKKMSFLPVQEFAA